MNGIILFAGVRVVWSRRVFIASAASLDENLRTTLCSHSHHIVAEALQAVMHESAVTLGDILLRRVPVALGACWSETCSLEAANRIGTALGWSQERVDDEFERFELEREKFLHPKIGSIQHSAISIQPMQQ